MDRPHLAAALLRVDVSRHGEASVQQLPRVVLRGVQQLLEVGVLGHVLVTRFPPLSHRLANTDAQTEALGNSSVKTP